MCCPTGRGCPEPGRSSRSRRSKAASRRRRRPRAGTALGGPDAPFAIEETVPLPVDVPLSRLGTPGLAHPDRFGRTVPW